MHIYQNTMIWEMHWFRLTQSGGAHSKDYIFVETIESLFIDSQLVELKEKKTPRIAVSIPRIICQQFPQRCCNFWAHIFRFWHSRSYEKLTHSFPQALGLSARWWLVYAPSRLYSRTELCQGPRNKHGSVQSLQFVTKRKLVFQHLVNSRVDKAELCKIHCFRNQVQINQNFLSSE